MEPERKIEKWLRVFAKKRREQAGDAFEMPAAARARLQREISRRSPGKTGGGFFSNFFAGFRPRLAFALCFIALAAVGAWLLLPFLTEQKPESLASATLQQAKSPLHEQPAPPVVSPLTLASAPVARDKEERVANEKRMMSPEVAATKPTQPSEPAGNRLAIVSADNAPAPEGALENGVTQMNLFAGINAASAPRAPGVLADKTEAPMDTFANSGALNKDRADLPTPLAAPEMDTNVALGALTVAAAEPEAQKKLDVKQTSAAPPAGGVVFDSVAKSDAAGASLLASQHFYRVDAAARRSAKTPAGAAPVLASFRVEQNGGELRIVDADGSIYTGTVQLAAAETASRTVFASAFKNAPTASAAKPLPQAAMAQNHFFRVAGTNRNLRQNVVFSGNLIPITNGLLSWTNAGTFGGAGGGGGALREPPAAWMLLNSRISGTAVIGNQKGIEVNATPAR